jgi:hypothetical protein
MKNLNLKFDTCWSLTVGFISENTRDKRKYIDTLPEALGTINSKKKTASKLDEIFFIYIFQIYAKFWNLWPF